MKTHIDNHLFMYIRFVLFMSQSKITCIDNTVKNDIQTFIEKIIKNKNSKINHNIFHDEILKKFLIDYNAYVRAYNRFIPTFIDENDKSQNVNIFVLTTLSYVLVEALELIKNDIKSLISLNDSNNITYGRLINKLCKRIGYDHNQSENIKNIFLVEFRNAIYHMDYYIENEYLIFPIKEKKHKWDYEKINRELQTIQVLFDIIDVEITKRIKNNNLPANSYKNYQQTIINKNMENDVKQFLYDLKEHDVFKIYADKFYSRTTTKPTLNYSIYQFTLEQIIRNDKYIQMFDDDLNVFLIKSYIIALNGAIELINKFLKQVFIDHEKTSRTHATLESLITNLCDILHYDERQKIKYNDIFLSDFRSATTHVRYYIENDTLVCINKSVKTIWSTNKLKIRSELIENIIEIIKNFHMENDLQTEGFQ